MIALQALAEYSLKTSEEETSLEIEFEPDDTSFDLTISQDQADDKVNFCASYTGTKEKTNMVVIEIELLSGFVPTKDALLSLKNTKAIKKVEYDEKENNIASY